MALGEAFTVLAVLEATDKMSRVLEHVDGSLNSFSQTATHAGASATEAGAKIDESLLKTASGADAVELADIRLQAAQNKLAASSAKQAEAERALLDAQAQAAAAADGDAAATERLVAASDALTEAQKRTAKAASEVSVAQDRQAVVGQATALSTVEGRAAADEATAAQQRLAEQQARSAAGAGIASKAMKFGALAVAAVGYESIKAAGNFESMTEHLVTDAGESQQNIGLIRSGMLSLATATGTTTEQMAQGMYHIESAGFHGQKALDVLKTAAEGAKVGGADLDTIGQSLTGTMNAFGPSAGTATQMMNAMIATVGAGDMKMQDLGSSLGNVAAIGASAGLSYSQVGGAIATMTAQNVTAQRATQDLASTIGSLQNAQGPAVKEMTAMGLSSIDVSNNLGKRGLTGTLDVLVKAVAAHTQGGQVMVNSLNASKAAASQANSIIGQMSPTMAKMAQSWQAGTMSTANFNKAVDALPPSQKRMYTQFEGLVKKSGDFATQISATTPMAQTFNASLAKMLGGSTGLNTALMLSGQHAGAFADNVKTIGDAASKSGSSVDNWDKIQGTFNQKLDVAKASMEAAGISIGTVLLPVVSKVASGVAGVVGPMATWIAHNQKLVGLLLAIIGPALAIVGVIKTISMVTKIWAAAQLMLDAAMDANPIGLLVIAIAALVGGLIYAYTHFKTFRDVVNQVFSAVKTVVMTYINLVILYFKLLVAGAMLAWHGLQAAWDGITTAAKAVWSFLVGAWNAVYSTTMAVWNSISGFFEKWWPLLLMIFAAPIAILIAAWNHFHTAVTEAAVTAWHAIAGFFTGIWRAISAAATAAWALISEYIIAPMRLLWSWLVSGWGTVMGWLSTAWNKIASVAAAGWALVRAYILNPMQQIWNDVTGIFGQVAHFISQAFDDVLSVVANIGDKFLDVGRDIVMGIVHGVEHAGSYLFDTLRNLAGDALNAAKSFLGINSPSKLFADHVGSAIPEGIAKGVRDNAHLAHRAVTAMAGTLAGAGQASTGGFTLAAAGTGLAYSGGRGGGVSLVANFDLRNAVVSNPQAMQQLADQVGRSITTQLARAGVHIRS